MDWLEIWFIYRFDICRRDIKILEQPQPNYPLWPNSLIKALKVVSPGNKDLDTVIIIKAISAPILVEK